MAHVRRTLRLAAAVIITAGMTVVTTMPRPAHAAGPVPAGDPASLVNTLVGTTGGGNVFPGADTPFGMLQWSPDTSPDRSDGGGYEYKDTALRGFSLTHISGPGCGAFGDVPILPLTGALPSGDPGAHMEPFTHTGEVGNAGYYAVHSGSPAITTELTATRHSAMSRLTYPATTQADLLFKLLDSQNGSVASSAAIVGNNEVQGSTSSGFFCGAGDQYTVHFDITFDHPFTASTVVTEPKQPGPNSIFLRFDTTANPVLQAKVGISYVSAANARANWQQDNPGWNFDAVTTAAHAAWNTALSNIQIGGGTVSEQQLFYTSLYHTALHPNVFSDINGQYIGFDNKVHTVVAPQRDQYANYSGWDIYHSQVQLAALMAPSQMGDSVQSMLNDAAQNNGMLPKWALANGETYVMVGDPADGIIAGSYAFGARNFDQKTALADMLHEATVPNNIRPGLSQYESNGYLPYDGSYGCCNFYGPVATQLEYNEADMAIAQFATAVGDSADAATLTQRAQNWKNVFNPATNLQTPKLANGEFVSGVGPTSSAGMVEGTAAQYRWVVPFNHQSLISAMGGDGVVNPLLDAFFSGRLDGSDPNGAFLVNEFELGVQDFYNYTRAPWGTQHVVNRLRTELFQNAPFFTDNNDDLGAESSLLAWSMLGMYPDVPGSGQLSINGPEFPLEVIHLAGGQSLTISAPNASTSNYYIQAMTLNGHPDNKTWFDASLLASGGSVGFTMGSTPNTNWGAAPQDGPPSQGTQHIAAIGFGNPSGQMVVQPGGAASASLGVQSTWTSPQRVSWTAQPTGGVTVTPSSGSFTVNQGGRRTAPVSITGGQTEGRDTVTFHLTSSTGVSVPDVVMGVAVAKPGELWPYYNNTGISDDSNTATANYDGDGFAYSAQALAATGVTPGTTLTSNGLTYTWPNVPAGQLDNIESGGQTIQLNPTTASRIGFLGSATNTGSSGTSGTLTVSYSDGTSQQIPVTFSDWTLGANSFKPVAGNSIVAATAYRNQTGGGHQNITTNVFSLDAALSAGKTVQSITLPASVNQGQFHVFAVSFG